MKNRYFIRIAATILVLIMSLSAVSCTKKEEDKPEAEWIPDYDAAYAKHKPDDVMYTVGGINVTWDILFSYLAPGVRAVTDYTNGHPSFTDTDGIEYEMVDAMISQAIDSAYIKYAASQNGVSLSDEDIAGIDLEVVENSAELWKQFRTPDVERYHYHALPILAQKTVAKLYGETGEAISDAETASLISVNDYVQAIFIHYDNIESARAFIASADAVSSEGVEGGYSLIANLKQLFNDERAGSYDPMYAIYPEGAVFYRSEDIPAYIEAAFALADGTYSKEPIAWGNNLYTVVLKLPLSYDAYIYDSSLRAENTLRILAAYAKFDNYIYNLNPEVVKKNEIDITKTKELFTK